MNRLTLHLFWIFIALGICSCQSPVANRIYVATDGDDSQSGTEESPLASLEAARNTIRRLKQQGSIPKGGIEVWVKGGNYLLDQTFALNADDSGTEEAPLIYRSAEGEAVYLSGGRKLDTKFAQKVSDQTIVNRLPENARDQVYVLDLKAQGISEYGQLYQYGFSLPVQPYPLELFIDGKPQRLARWPNEGTMPIGKVLDPGSHPREGDTSNRGGQFQYNYDRADRWTEAKDIWLQGIFSYGYADDNLQVEWIDRTRKIIKVVQPHIYMIRSSEDENTSAGHLRGYFVYNLLEEIDVPGEYFVDQEQGKLYFWPPKAIGECELAVSVMEEPMVAMEGVSHVSLSGFTFEYARGMGVYMEEGENNVISQCTFRNLGLMGIMMGKGVAGPNGPIHEFVGEPVARQVGNLKANAYMNSVWDRKAGRNHRIEGCQFYQLGAGGLILDGGNRSTLSSGNNEVLNSEFHHFNRWNKTYAPAIEIKGVGNRIRHNYIHDAPHTVILLAGNDHLIEFNEITRVVQGSDDMGAIYMGRNPSEQGNVLRYNYFHHFEDEESRVAAIYFDDGQNGGQVFGNVFYKVGSPRFGAIFVHGGHDQVFENNLFIDCIRGLGNSPWDQQRWEDYMKADLWQARLKTDLDISKPPYSERYPELVSALNKTERTCFVRNNLVYRCKTFSVPQYQLTGNWITDEDPGFVDLEMLNFNLKEDARLFEEIPGFQPIPFDSIGLMTKGKSR